MSGENHRLGPRQSGLGKPRLSRQPFRVQLVGVFAHAKVVRPIQAERPQINLHLGEVQGLVFAHAFFIQFGKLPGIAGLDFQQVPGFWGFKQPAFDNAVRTAGDMPAERDKPKLLAGVWIAVMDIDTHGPQFIDQPRFFQMSGLEQPGQAPVRARPLPAKTVKQIA
jgi:hypothetical protein